MGTIAECSLVSHTTRIRISTNVGAFSAPFCGPRGSCATTSRCDYGLTDRRSPGHTPTRSHTRARVGPQRVGQ